MPTQSVRFAKAMPVDGKWEVVSDEALAPFDVDFKKPDGSTQRLRFCYWPLGFRVFTREPLTVSRVMDKSQAQKLGVEVGWEVACVTSDKAEIRDQNKILEALQQATTALPNKWLPEGLKTMVIKSNSPKNYSALLIEKALGLVMDAPSFQQFPSLTLDADHPSTLLKMPMNFEARKMDTVDMVGYEHQSWTAGDKGGSRLVRTSKNTMVLTIGGRLYNLKRQLGIGDKVAPVLMPVTLVGISATCWYIGATVPAVVNGLMALLQLTLPLRERCGLVFCCHPPACMGIISPFLSPAMMIIIGSMNVAAAHSLNGDSYLHLALLQYKLFLGAILLLTWGSLQTWCEHSESFNRLVMQAQASRLVQALDQDRVEKAKAEAKARWKVIVVALFGFFITTGVLVWLFLITQDVVNFQETSLATLVSSAATYVIGKAKVILLKKLMDAPLKLDDELLQAPGAALAGMDLGQPLLNKQ